MAGLVKDWQGWIRSRTLFKDLESESDSAKSEKPDLKQVGDAEYTVARVVVG